MHLISSFFISCYTLFSSIIHECPRSGQLWGNKVAWNNMEMNLHGFSYSDKDDKFWSISLNHFIKHNQLIPEELANGTVDFFLLICVIFFLCLTLNQDWKGGGGDKIRPRIHYDAIKVTNTNLKKNFSLPGLLFACSPHTQIHTELAREEISPGLNLNWWATPTP